MSQTLIACKFMNCYSIIFIYLLYIVSKLFYLLFIQIQSCTIEFRIIIYVRMILPKFIVSSTYWIKLNTKSERMSLVVQM